jgi:hypothetical protein
VLVHVHQRTAVVYGEQAREREHSGDDGQMAPVSAQLSADPNRGHPAHASKRGHAAKPTLVDGLRAIAIAHGGRNVPRIHRPIAGTGVRGAQSLPAYRWPVFASGARCVAGAFALPVTRWLIARGEGHTVVHETGIHGGPSSCVVGAIAAVAFIFGTAVLVSRCVQVQRR